jgi:hypothetical protein
MSQWLTDRGLVCGRFGGQTGREISFRIRLSRIVRKLAGGLKHPAACVVNLVVFGFLAVTLRVAATAANNPQMAELLQAGGRLLALAFVLPLNPS